ADGGRQVVGAPGGEVVPGVGGDEAGHRQPRLEAQLLAQLDLVGIGTHRRFNRLDQLGLQTICDRVGAQADACSNSDTEQFLHGCDSLMRNSSGMNLRHAFNWLSLSQSDGETVLIWVKV